MSHTHGNSDNQKGPTHDDSLPDVNIKVEKFYLSPLSDDDQEGILITAETEKSTTEKRISLELEYPKQLGLLQFNYKGPKSDDYFPLNSTVKIKEIVLKKSIDRRHDLNDPLNKKTINEIDDFEDRVKYIFRDDDKYIITKNGYDCRYLCRAAIEDEYTVVLQMKLEIIDTNNSFRRFAFYLNDGSGLLLCHAIRNKDMDTIEVLLNSKFNINARNEAGLTPLHVAVDLQMSDVNIKILNSLLRNQANLNARDEIGRTPLHYAVNAGNVDVVDILLKRGADYKLKDECCKTPFDYAAIHLNLDMIKVFLDNNADPNIGNPRNRTPLHAIGETTFINTGLGIKAVDKDTYLKIINALVQKGANINFQDSHGETPLHHAVMNENSAFIQALLECNADPAIESFYGDTALHLAIQRNNYNIVQLISKKNPNIDIKNKIGKTALHQAVIFKCYRIIDLLLQYGANVDLQDANGKTALHLAIESRELSIVTLLLKNKANVNLKDALGRTALLFAVQVPKIPIEIIESILNSTDDIDAKDELGRAALHYAALNTDDRVLEALCKAKANVNVKDSEGNTPLHLTMSWENECVTRLEPMQVLVNYQADVNAVNNNMSTPLHYACGNKNVEAVKYLIQNGADSSMRDRDERTVFHYACMIGRDHHQDIRKAFGDLLNILVEEDVSVNWVDKFGTTPLHYVVEQGDDWRFVLGEPLLEIGSDINIEDEYQNTVIDTLLKPRYTFQYQDTKLFIKHVIKMKEMGMWIHEKTLDKFNKVNDQCGLQKIQLYVRDCRKEIDLMNTNIDQSDITYYDFLKKRTHEAVNYTRNRKVVNAIKSDELLAVFPIYGHFLKCHLRDIQRRSNLYEKIRRFLKSNIFERLPTDCMHEIFQYLNKFDLDIFLQALKPVVLIK